jgi:hypothetical protein
LGAVIQAVTAFKQNITGGAFEALAAGTNDSLSIVEYAPGSQAYLEEVISGNSANKMEVAIFSPRFGDNQSGLRLQHQFNPTLSGADGDPQLLMPRELDIPVYSTDTLNVQVNGTATNNVDVVLQLYYENILGMGQKLATWERVSAMFEFGGPLGSRVLGIEVTVTPGATGNYGTAVALNANDDRLLADYDYALLGYTTDQPATCFFISGPDTGFVRIPMPGHWNSQVTSNWFIEQAKRRGTPHIPILSANNKGATLLSGVSSNNAGATKLSLILAQLNSKFVS